MEVNKLNFIRVSRQTVRVESLSKHQSTHNVGILGVKLMPNHHVEDIEYTSDLLILV